MPETESHTLVTGITGFIGLHVALNLREQGYSVRGTVRNREKAEKLLGASVPEPDAFSCVEADLLSDDGWAEAMAGVEVVHHVASPFPLEEPKDPDTVIGPAKEGTRRVLRAAKEAGVRRVVVTASVASIMYGHDASHRQPFTEEDFTDPEAPKLSTYIRSKTLAEQTAWELARELDLELCTVHPGLVLGPLAAPNAGTSVGIVQELLGGKLPGCPRLNFPVVDVRDVAELHRLAGETSGAAGNRYACTSNSMWFFEIAQLLRKELPDFDRKIPKRELPNWLVKLISLFDPSIRAILPELGMERAVSSDKAQRELGWRPRTAEEAVLESGRTLVKLGLV